MDQISEGDRSIHDLDKIKKCLEARELDSDDENRKFHEKIQF